MIMKVRTELKYLRIAPRKVRLVADLIRRKKVDKAQAILQFTVKKGADVLLKLLNTGIADAQNNFQLDPNNLYIYKIAVDGGPINKRWRARSRGMAAPIQKRTSHIILILDEIEKGKKAKVVKKVPVKKEVESTKKKETPKLRPVAEKPKPKQVRGLKKFFRRKSI